jgi:hypothetical protein
MQRRSFVITAALVVGIALGALLGPTLRGSIAKAQAQPPTPTQPAGPLSNLSNLFLDKLAAALHIQRPTLDSAIKDAGTSTVDEAVKQGKLTQPQADRLKQRIQNGDVGGFWGGRGAKGGRDVAGVQQAMLDAAAKTLKITSTELMQQLRSGQTLAQLAQAHGTTEQNVTSAVVAAAKTQLDKAVANGSLARGQADAIYNRLQQAGSNLFGKHGHGSGRNGKMRGAPAQPQAQNNATGL